MQVQLWMLAKGDKSNFTKWLQVPHIELNGKTLGGIGAGIIGREVIAVAQAMGMKILASSRRLRADENGIRYVSNEVLLQESDVGSLHCPLTPETVRLAHL